MRIERRLAAGRKRAGVYVVVLLLSAGAASAQTNTGEIAGVVRDSAGDVLPGAVVVAEHVESGARVERTTDEQGRYTLQGLQVGTYRITADLAGFRRVVRSGVTVQLGQLLALDLTLDIGAIAQEIFGTPNFGRIFSAKAPREMQVGVKLSF